MSDNTHSTPVSDYSMKRMNTKYEDIALPYTVLLHIE